jgi:hypothetical protein
MSKYTIHLNTTNWYCECCGSGTHFVIHLYEEGKRVWSTSRDDQFGGVLDPDDEDLDLATWENFITGMQKALELAGHEVVLVEFIDETDPWYDSVEEEEEGDYRDDLL